MQQGRNSTGYTILEVIIVLSVTSVLFVISAIAYNGVRQKTEFATAVRNLEQKIIDVINDVETGYYPSDLRSCISRDSLGQTPDIQATPSSQGTNQGCVYLGKIIMFNGNTMEVNTVIGNRTAGGNNIVSIESSKPTITNKVDSYKILSSYNVNGNKIWKLNPSSPNDSYEAIAIVKTIKNTSGNPISGSSYSDAILLNSRPISGNVISNLTEASRGLVKNGFNICVKSEYNDQWGIITVGGSNNQLTTTSKIINSDIGCKA